MNISLRRGTRRAAGPWLLTGLRFALAPLLWWTLVAGLAVAAAAVFLLACATDALDGRLARRNRVASPAGMQFDAAADCAVIVSGVLGLSRLGVCPAWAATVIMMMYAQFVVTSVTGRLGYDPLGRYYGGFLYTWTGLSMLVPAAAAAYGPHVLVCFTGACVVSRLTALSRSHGDGRQTSTAHQHGRVFSRSG